MIFHCATVRAEVKAQKKAEEDEKRRKAEEDLKRKAQEEEQVPSPRSSTLDLSLPLALCLPYFPPFNPYGPLAHNP